MTTKQKELIKDNYNAYVSNFGTPRIEKENYGKGFYVFTDDSDRWTQYCYNIDYLNGWLYGCVQANNKVVKSIR